jgi:hypothetical protein
MAPAGFNAMFDGMIGPLTLYLTDDDAPPSQRVDEAELNPRGRWLLEMHTSNPERLERKMTRYFLGVCSGSAIPDDIDVRGVVGGLDGVPMMFADTEGALHPHAFDRFEVVQGMTALNQGFVKGGFRT